MFVSLRAQKNKIIKDIYTHSPCSRLIYFHG